MRELNLNFPDLTVLLVDPYAPAIVGSERVLEGPGIDLHAGEAETSLILHLDPAGVHVDRLVDWQPAVGREFLDYVPVASVCPDGGWGRATLATAEKGRRLFALMVDGTVRYCSQSFAKAAELKGAIPEGSR